MTSTTLFGYQASKVYIALRSTAYKSHRKGFSCLLLPPKFVMHRLDDNPEWPRLPWLDIGPQMFISFELVSILLFPHLGGFGKTSSVDRFPLLTSLERINLELYQSSSSNTVRHQHNIRTNENTKRSESWNQQIMTESWKSAYQQPRNQRINLALKFKHYIYKFFATHCILQ